MKKELQKEIYDIDPIFFSEALSCLNGEMNEMQTCMYWGICCGDGWYEPIKKLAYKTKIINENAQKFNVEYISEQIKQKFGGFRCYWRENIINTNTTTQKETKEIETLSEMLIQAIKKCEEECWETCEECGSKKNIVTTSGWITRICRECSKKSKRFEDETKISCFGQAYNFLNINHKEGFVFNDNYYWTILQAFFCQKDKTREKWYLLLNRRIQEKYLLFEFAKMFEVPMQENDYDLLKQIIFSKFEYNKETKKELLLTKGKELINSNRYHDNLFGCCTCEDCKNKQKKNLYGKILMEVRKELNNF